MKGKIFLQKLTEQNTLEHSAGEMTRKLNVTNFLFIPFRPRVHLNSARLAFIFRRRYIVITN